MLLTAAIIGSSTAGLTGLARWYKGSLKKKTPCITAGARVSGDALQVLGTPQALDIVLPMPDYTCPALPDTATYTVAYLSPEGNPTIDPNLSKTDIPYKTNGFTYDVWLPKNQAFVFQNNVYSYLATPGQTGPVSDLGPLNLCPQVLAGPVGATATPLPALPEGTLGGPRRHNGLTVDAKAAQDSAVLWALPGRPGAVNPINVPAQNGAAGFGLCSILYLQVVQTTVLYLELGGGAGGSVPLYTTGVTAAGLAEPTPPGFPGGVGGVTFGLLQVQAGDVLKIFLASAGTDFQSDPNAVVPFNGNGQGGSATVLGGANGGGASYIARYANRVFGLGALEAAWDSKPGYEIVCVAGGGGGASVNASGGHAGFCETDALSGLPAQDGLAFGDSIVTSRNAYAGGLPFVIGAAPLKQSLRPNGLSGGGGAGKAGGRSNVTSPSGGPRSCFGSQLVPFQPRGSEGGGGASVNTQIGSGGGGGGGGQYGGGAGGYNGVPKPNNVHGAGGGGSSSIGTLMTTAAGRSLCLNPLRSTGWAGAPEVLPWKNRRSRNGYLVIAMRNVV